MRTRLIGQADEQCNPRTSTTVDDRLHVRPLLGACPVAKLTGETIDGYH